MAACFYFCLSIKTFEATIKFVVKDLITCLDFEIFGICIHFLREFSCGYCHLSFNISEKLRIIINIHI